MRIHWELEKDGVRGTRTYHSASDVLQRAEDLMKKGATEVRVIEVQRMKYHNQARTVVQVFKKKTDKRHRQ